MRNTLNDWMAGKSAAFNNKDDLILPDGAAGKISGASSRERAVIPFINRKTTTKN